ncbi:hypothetical protein EXIGLDRAFT_724521 [Exidia glandulosa HHB12029]|uniref:Uncharacterized protein n=1 Tax=Exidia glandulosa HHB12029 TaxID=1314781 RepID=A0A165EDP0_EXIGL|nr:hypothetical protein EXIGLDRAFT_724521 [Exidia glandulosa HHB12029]
MRGARPTTSFSYNDQGSGRKCTQRPLHSRPYTVLRAKRDKSARASPAATESTDDRFAAIASHRQRVSSYRLRRRCLLPSPDPSPHSYLNRVNVLRRRSFSHLSVAWT